MDRAVMSLADLERLAAIRRLEDRVPASLQNPSSQFAQAAGVLDEQDRLRAGGRRNRRPRGHQRYGDAFDAREIDLEGRAVPKLAVDPDGPAALLDNPVHGRESQPRALALLLGCEEWFEEMRLGLLVHP